MPSCSPQQDHTYSPAQKIMSRKLRDISVSIPNQVKPNPKNKHKPWILGEVAENRGQRSCVVQTPLGLICRNHKQIRKAEVRQQEPYKPRQDDLDVISLPEETAMPTPTETPTEPAHNSPTPVPSPSWQSAIEPAGFLTFFAITHTRNTVNALRRSTRIRRPPIRLQVAVGE